jgi:hypothetical protein
MRLSENTAECTAGDFSMFGNYCGDEAARNLLRELHVTTGLRSLVEAGFQKFAAKSR